MYRGGGYKSHFTGLQSGRNILDLTTYSATFSTISINFAIPIIFAKNRTFNK